jgi:hexosaminidase
VADYFAREPVPAELGLTPAEEKLVLGGEASVWTEWTGPDNLDAYLWPAAAAVAEKLWSPRAPADAAALSGRLPATEAALRATGVAAGQPPPIKLAGLEPNSEMARALRQLADAVEPAVGDLRAELLPDVGQTTPLNELADWARPEARQVRAFAADLDHWLLADGPLTPEAATAFRARFADWTKAGELAAQFPAASTPRAQGRIRTARALADLGRLGDEAIDILINRRAPPADWAERASRVMAAAAPNPAGVVFPFLPQLRLLAAAVADPSAREAPSRAERIRRLEATFSKPKHV